jgi:uncharacterized protein YcgI (DUF1989 family)
MPTLLEDTTDGRMHDTLIAACDKWRYLELLGEERRGHRSCEGKDGRVSDFLGIFVLSVEAMPY